MKGDSCKYCEVPVSVNHKLTGSITEVLTHTIMAATSANATAATASLPPLPPSMALYRVAKLPIAEICMRLTAFGLRTDGTKQILAARLHTYLQTLPEPPESPTGTDDGSDHDSAASFDATEESPRRGRHGRRAAREKSRHGRRSRQRHCHGRLSQGDAKAIRALLRCHDRRRPHSSPSRSRSRSRSWSPATTASDRSSEESSRSSPRITASSPSPSRSVSSESSLQRSRRRSRGRTHRTSTCKTRRSRHSRQHHHRDDSSGKLTGTLPAILDRMKGRIRRGEFVELDMLLQVNLRASGPGRTRSDGATGPDSRYQRRATINDFTSWTEAWSVYAAVLTAYFPHLAPRLFHYQPCLHSECKQGRMAGPFDEPPFSPFHCSGMVVVVPKQDGSCRVITHLSAPEGRSINNFIDPRQ